ncbi:MAG: LysM peptidoglycan-binding domain-containing protein [Acidimicrobiales bacterium]
MAIAEIYPTAPPDRLGTRPVLRLVDGPPASSAVVVAGRGRAPWCSSGGVAGTDSSDRRRFGSRRLGSRRRIWRNRLAVALVVCGVTLLLALPVSALGGHPVGAPYGAVAGGPVGGLVYVVQPGDTLWTIARQFDQGGDARRLAVALEARLGSRVVVPGERIRVP